VKTTLLPDLQIQIMVIQTAEVMVAVEDRTAVVEAAVVEEAADNLIIQSIN
jgi:hypothetical protein